MDLHTVKNGETAPLSRGFVTIATGKDKYYTLALNLLLSYKANGKSDLPFAIICDKDCPIAREFDRMVLLSQPHHSYMDKLYLHQFTPYDETIFIDADALILKDVNALWDDFSSMSDFSCYGSVLDLESRNGWFYYKDMGELQSQLTYGISMHGGLYYLRKTALCETVFSKALDFAKHYDRYVFHGFSKPADEPVLALSMALCNCKPCPSRDQILFLPRHETHLKINFAGELLFHKKSCGSMILHFGNSNVTRFLYQYLLADIHSRHNGHTGPLPVSKHLRLQLQCLPHEAKHFAKKLVKKHAPKKLLAFLRARK